MAKKRQEKKKAKGSKKVKLKDASESGNSKSLDFAGIPNRNLKKNLGC